ncbi:hypothetical protein MLD38_007089 [Melastoma candidum]|uniref:Uncharacterized protein n=1 Tax=Melastoma candidum TaxID=119954 RepID=A0ACB9RRC6_9MYRT|nr:hypothetical protein MLD38_007089 [Melastoma candidum]
MRGSLIQAIQVNEIHGSSTKRNKEWQEKLPFCQSSRPIPSLSTWISLPCWTAPTMPSFDVMIPPKSESPFTPASKTSRARARCLVSLSAQALSPVHRPWKESSRGCLVRTGLTRPSWSYSGYPLYTGRCTQFSRDACGFEVTPLQCGIPVAPPNSKRTGGQPECDLSLRLGTGPNPVTGAWWSNKRSLLGDHWSKVQETPSAREKIANAATHRYPVEEDLLNMPHP